VKAMPTCLVTGCGGFIGSSLAEFLLSQGCHVVGTIHRETRHITHLSDCLTVRRCDITDRPILVEIVRETDPDFVFHLAAEDLILSSWDDPEETFRVNVLGTLSLLEAIRRAGVDATVQIAGSSAEYGPPGPEELPIAETHELRPKSPYAVSKTTAVTLGHLYALRYEMRVHSIRPFQFIGPGKYPDACSEFARRIVEIERGRSEELHVGNLEVVRDLLDVRDGVRAMWLVAQSARSGDVYNIAAGLGYRIREVLERLLALASMKVGVREDHTRFRPLDASVIVGDNKKIRELGWQPECPLEDTLARILDYWRQSLD
jgi:GDP-4-dehydro-6-deoxy-D-mannose reductase